ncbi:NAD-dependent epimerase/dehydratase family protein [Salsipaludibacter albus]|uniref:NAD-dependent epimerase/dehydratase family protein n=1 Tax=Salsipaludibacter albus TaxID=2849650 RepID=UPI001EE47563|nr:NAD-dependent epimerase/dehydratase family protein [Salsipaludibacter albus]MBY5162184.1 NAD-dependent epimerase/dehydratase family protein [Salsipaludibacter albus]
MRVAVTGGTGFVGSHTVAALLDAGHDVRIIARRVHGVAPALEPLGVDPNVVEVALADMTDRGAIEAGLSGCDAVVHAASVYSFDPDRADEIARTNERGVRHVLESAIDAGMDPIVHVSSTLALIHDGEVGQVLTTETAPGDAPFPYAGSKARQEAYARTLQDHGHPVVITNPGGVWGPHDPHEGESHLLARACMRGLMSMLPRGTGIALVDVRDVAAAHAALVEPGRGPRRYVLAPYCPSLPELVDAVTTAAGRPRRTMAVPAPVATAATRLAGMARARFGWDLGGGPEGLWVSLQRACGDSSAAEEDLGITWRPFEECVADTVAWMQAEEARAA